MGTAEPDEASLRAAYQREMQLGSVEVAIELARRMVAKRPRAAGSLAILGRTLLLARRFGEAADAIRQALDEGAVDDDVARIATAVSGKTGDRSLAWHAYARRVLQGVEGIHGSMGREDLVRQVRQLSDTHGEIAAVALVWPTLDHAALLAASPCWHVHLAAASAVTGAVEGLLTVAQERWSELAREQQLALASALVACRRYAQSLALFRQAGLEPWDALPTSAAADFLTAASEAGDPRLPEVLDAVVACELPCRKDAWQLRSVLGGIFLDRREHERWLAHTTALLARFPDLVVTRATALIETGRPGEALTELEAFQRDRGATPMTLAALSRAAHALGLREIASRAVVELVSRRPDLGRLRSARVDFERLDDRPIAPPAGEISVVVVARDEIARLTWLLPYYRKLGARRFLVIDNGSTDGTVDLLRAQADVHVFETRENYVDAQAGLVWSNQVAREFLTDQWVLTVDADEALVYPDCEHVTLPELCHRLEREGAEGMLAPLVDMYAGPEGGATALAPGDDLLSRAPYFDGVAYRQRRIPLCPYVHLEGGPRFRALWGEHADPLAPDSVAMSKIPLVKWLPGTTYFHSTHMVSPLAVSRTTGALLHFKLLPDAVERSRSQAAAFLPRDAALGRQVGYQAERHPSSGYHGEHSVPYSGSECLLRTGLMTRGTPPGPSR